MGAVQVESSAADGFGNGVEHRQNDGRCEDSSESTRSKQTLAENDRGLRGKEDADDAQRQQNEKGTLLQDEESSLELINIARNVSREEPNLVESVVDPDNPRFDLREWLRLVMLPQGQQKSTTPRAGVIFRDLDVFGSESDVRIQETVMSTLWSPFCRGGLLSPQKVKPRHILKGFHGVLRGGEMLLVLGRPGSGCSTLLKTICGEHHELSLGNASKIHYNGVPQEVMLKEFKGEVLYNQETDKHFPHLTVGQTLELAASYRSPENPRNGMLPGEWAKLYTKVVMAVFGLQHTYNTKVGNEYVRGVSGGERKRVSIAEMTLSDALVAGWDNTTKGLDAASALQFVKALRSYAEIMGTAHAVAAYQASQAMYDVFDKVVVLYEGREIYFGPASSAKAYFEEMGWLCPPRQTTSDFLTAVTSASERCPRPGMEDKVPRTAEEFERYWHRSPMWQNLCQELDRYDNDFPSEAAAIRDLQEMKQQRQAKHTRSKSPYMASVLTQIKINLRRAYLRILMDQSGTITVIAIRIIQALIIGSIFYGTKDATQGFFAKASVLLFAVILNALVAIAEIQTLYAHRPIIEKHKSYAFYHPFTEAVASITLDVPMKFTVAIFFNIVLYFLGGLRREAGPFFLFFLASYLTSFAMSAGFRAIAAATKTAAQAMAIAGVGFLIMLLYAGFMIPIGYMKPWFKWLHYLNPAFYSFEMVLSNEFHNRDFVCSDIIPKYPNLHGQTFVCNVPGAEPGRWTVSGDAYMEAQYEYKFSHFWRNIGIMFAFLVAFMIAYFTASELNSSTSSTVEGPVFPRGRVPVDISDEESGNTSATVGAAGDEDTRANFLHPQSSVFSWRDIVYDIELKGESLRLLDNVSGWVKPGTLTALMGASGAGKTTLLDVLAQRVKTGVISGETLANGKPLDWSFARKIGYVQQQDLHLDTATVRESIRFSAVLRQPRSVPLSEKYDYVEHVISALGMEAFADAVVGRVGEGLSLEQRKRLTIAVELAAKPELLLFLDEPTSGLDSQSSWEICSLLRKLADGGQAILCTIHQPSAVLFEQFHRLLLLAPGGRTVYFGDIGQDSRTLLDYFQGNGARECKPEENPAEYMLEVLGSGDIAREWHEKWLKSPEHNAVQQELLNIAENGAEKDRDGGDRETQDEFAMPFASQLFYVGNRVFQQYWRTPTYIWAKLLLSAGSGLFIGFSFYQTDHSLQGLQNVIFAVFGVCNMLATLAQQIMPYFVCQRDLFEVRERPSRTYSWKVFLMANIIVEIPYQVFSGIVIYATFYYSLAGRQSSDRQGLVLLYCIQFFSYASSFAHLVVAAMPNTESADAVVVLLFSMMLSFNGVLIPPVALPGFWVFMYRVSPLTYWVSGIVATIVHGRPVECSATELSTFDPPANQTCQQYLELYLERSPGTLLNPKALSNCQLCGLTTADQFVSQSKINWEDRWRNWGIGWVYIVFNIAVAVLLYYLFRVRGSKVQRK